MFLKVLLFLHTLTLLLLPLYVVRFSILSIPFTLLEVLLVLSVTASVVYVVVNKVPLKTVRTAFDIPLLFLLIAAGLSLLVTPDLRGGMGIFRAYFLEPMLFYYSLVLLGRLTHGFRFILFGLIGSAFLVCLLGLVQKLTGQFIFAEHEWIQGRISAFYNSANAVALLIGPVVPLLALLFYRTKQKKLRLFFLSSLVFFSLIMLWTKSKGGIIAEVFSLGIVLYGLLSEKIRVFRRFWYFVPAAFLLLSVIFFAQVYQMYDTTIRLPGSKIEDDTLQIRYATWLSTTEILQEETVLGTGLNGFKHIYDDYKLADFQEDFQYPHNTVFNFWTETGLLGLTSLIVLLFYCFKVCLELFGKKKKYIGLGLLASFSYIVAHGLVDVPYFKNDLSVQFWSIVALTQLVQDRIKEHT